MRYLLLALAAAALLFGVTLPKLYRMLMIRGVIPGAVASQQVITEKWHEPANPSRHEHDIWWIAFNGQSAKTPGPHRLNVFRETWDGLSVGDSIEVLRLPGRETRYLRNDIYASDGNFVFDCGLVLAELACVTVGAWKFTRWCKQPRQPAPVGPHSDSETIHVI